MSRSKWKGFFFSKKNLPVKKNLLIINNKNVILTKFSDKYVNLYNGKEVKKVFITKEKIGLKFGSLIQTRFLKVSNNLIVKKRGAVKIK